MTLTSPILTLPTAPFTIQIEQEQIRIVLCNECDRLIAISSDHRGPPCGLERGCEQAGGHEVVFGYDDWRLLTFDWDFHGNLFKTFKDTRDS